MSASTPLPNASYPPPPCRVGPRPSDWTHRRPIHPVARFEALFSARPWCLWTLAAQRATGRARIQPRFHTCMSQDILCMRCLALCGGACTDLDVIGLGHAWDEIVDKGIFLVQDLNCGARARHKHTHAHASTQTHTHTQSNTHTRDAVFTSRLGQAMVSLDPFCPPSHGPSQYVLRSNTAGHQERSPQALAWAAHLFGVCRSTRGARGFLFLWKLRWAILQDTHASLDRGTHGDLLIQAFVEGLVSTRHEQRL